MDLKEQIIQEYLTQGGGFRKLAATSPSGQTIERHNACSVVLYAHFTYGKIPASKNPISLYRSVNGKL